MAIVLFLGRCAFGRAEPPQAILLSPKPQSAGPAAPGSDQTVDTPSDDRVESMVPHVRKPGFWLSGQANFIFQAHPSFHADYSGKNSLNPK